MSRGFTSTYRISLLATLTFLTFIGLGTRLVFLHVINRDQMLESVEKARRQITTQRARRGDILDTHRGILATSHSLMVVGVDPQAVSAADQAKWPELAKILGLTLDQVRATFTTKFRTEVMTPNAADAPDAGLVFNFRSDEKKAEIVAKAAPVEGDDDENNIDEPDENGNRKIRFAALSDQVSEETCKQVLKLQIKGVYGNRIYKRSYPQATLAAHVIGYVDGQGKPAVAMERYADFFLRGEDGWLESEKDGKRQELAQFRTRNVPASDGYNVVLTLDSAVQNIVEDELAAIAKQFDPKKATIIVSDPRTGYILAMANYPNFDLNAYGKVPKDEASRLRNIAVSDIYEPGSVFKIVAASGALDMGLVTPDTRFDCTAKFAMGKNGKMYDLPAEDISDHFDKPLSVAEVIMHSSNKGAAQLALLMGDQKFYDYAKRFGFGQLSGLPPLGGEQVGMMMSPENPHWSNKTSTRMPIGQGVAVTPIQMHQAMSAVADGGVLLTPLLIREVLDSKGDLVYRFGRRERTTVMTQQTAREMCQMLEGVASKTGTAPEAEIPGYEVAGKTATAQKVMPTVLPSGKTVMAYSTRHHVGSFIGFFPASNPQVAISVIVDDADARCPGGVAYGHIVAAPSFKRIALKLISYLDIKSPAEVNHARLALAGGPR